PDNPNLDLLLALANCQFPPARTQAHQWIQAIPTHLITASPLISYECLRLLHLLSEKPSIYS
ncbi:hypothetical protein, partial [Moorena sp. SIO4G3]|uniref:hypothetical protein n=1 Tax=Moorena sp. SIO4G3 TaxID=2607821 RepID=UPI0025EC2167